MPSVESFSGAKKLAYILNIYFFPGPNFVIIFLIIGTPLYQSASIWIFANSKEVFQKIHRRALHNWTLDWTWILYLDLTLD